MIDCHTLYLPDYNKQWLKDLESDLVNQPICHHIVAGIPNNFTEARLNGYKHGTNQYITFADCDDRVSEGIYTKLLDKIETSNASFVWAGEQTVNDSLTRVIKSNIPNGTYRKISHQTTHQYVHGVIVYRRELLDELLPLLTVRTDYMDWVISSCMFVLGKARGYDDPISVPEIGRLWRFHKNNSSLKATGRREAGEFIANFYHEMGLKQELINLTYVKKVLK